MAAIIVSFILRNRVINFKTNYYMLRVKYKDTAVWFITGTKDAVPDKINPSKKVI